MRRSALGVVTVAVAALVGCGPATDDGTGDVGQIVDMAKAAVPTGKNFKTNPGSVSKPKGKISYHNGSVMTGSSNVYAIWYGDWANNTAAQTIVSDFLGNVGASPYFQINARYTNASG